MAATIVVEGVEIPTFLIAEEVQHHPGRSAPEAWTAAGKALAIKALLLHRASELGLTADPQVDEEGREETPQEALIRATLDAEVEIEPPTEAECRRVYHAQQDRFTAPALIEASHILFEPSGQDEDAFASAQERALTALDALSKRPSLFAGMARDLSGCPSGQVGGSLGQLAFGDVVQQIERALGELMDGELSPQIVRSRFGWHILRLDRRIEGRLLPFEYVEEQIRLHLESRAWTAAAARYAAGLAQAAKAQGVAISLSRNGAAKGGSLVLGDFLASYTTAGRIEAWLDAVDPDLAARLTSAAAAAGDTAAEFTRKAATSFVNDADDERWTQLISAAQGADDPALGALAQILRSRLAPVSRTYTIFKRA